MNDLFDLSGRHAVVVGGVGDIGKELTKGLAEAGAQVVIITRDTRGDAYAESLCSLGFQASCVHADFAVRDQIAPSFAAAAEKLGSVDILVNAAGIQRRHPAEEFPLGDWDSVLEVNLTTTFQYCQLAALDMIPRGYGKIINIASMLSFFGGITVSAYAASKGGVAQLTKALSNDWGAKGLNVNAIAPGYIATKLNTALVNNPARSAEILSRVPQNRWGAAEDLKGAAVFLASRASDYVNGIILPVDGGYLGR